jgi:hypothetical protein
MTDEPEKAVDKMAEDARNTAEAVEAEVKDDVTKARGEGGSAKRPWWKFWAQT